MILLSSIEEKSELEKIIDFKRKEMIKIGIQEGLHSKRTIILSQQLDIYIAKYRTISLNAG